MDAGGSSNSVSWVTPLPITAVIAVLPKIRIVGSSFQLGDPAVVAIFVLGLSPEDEPTRDDDMETFTVRAEIHIV